ncbi:hypothetical protein cypCar_00024608 [Cyprinus carpio]|nr:hypothetical protein cypCar_00024608 [Cyprinus carpio]
MLASVLNFFLLLLFLSPNFADDTVAEDIGPHQLERLVKLLTAHECEELISAISQPEESIFQHLERLSAKSSNKLILIYQAPCRSALKDWLQIHGMQIYYDKLCRALQQISRTDIAIEVGKNINQNRTLAMQTYVDGYHELVNQMATHLEKHESEYHEEVLQYSAKPVKGFTWKDVDLVVKRQPVPPYQPHLLDRLWPVIYGLLLGLAGALLISVVVLLISIYVSHGNRTKSKAKHQPHRCPFLSVVTSEIHRPEDTRRPSNGCSGH